MLGRLAMGFANVREGTRVLPPGPSTVAPAFSFFRTRITTCHPSRVEPGPYFVPGLPHAVAHSRRVKVKFPHFPVLSVKVVEITKQGEVMPPGFCRGDRVISKVNWASEESDDKVVLGDEGRVVGSARRAPPRSWDVF